MSEADERHSKTEEATEKRITDAIAKGQVPFTREIPLFLSSCAIWVSIAYLLSDAVAQLCLVFLPLWGRSGEFNIATQGDAAVLLADISKRVLTSMLPIVGFIGAAALIGSLFQSKGMVLERIKPQPSRISPASGWRRLFGAEGIAHNLKSTLGLIAVAVAASTVLAKLLQQSLGHFEADPATLLLTLPAMFGQILAVMLAGMLIVTALDTILTRFNWRRGLRMTKKEITDEAKETNGDPQIKLRMRMLARRRIRKRMLAAVPSATVVITNPTHYAVALRFVRGETPAPIVVAKGVDHLALKIREAAIAHGKPIVEDQPLARALYASVEIDGVIPPELYQAVARVILFIDKSAKRSVN